MFGRKKNRRYQVIPDSQTLPPTVHVTQLSNAHQTSENQSKVFREKLNIESIEDPEEKLEEHQQVQRPEIPLGSAAANPQLEDLEDDGSEEKLIHEEENDVVEVEIDSETIEDPQNPPATLSEEVRLLLESLIVRTSQKKGKLYTALNHALEMIKELLPARSPQQAKIVRDEIKQLGELYKEKVEKDSQDSINQDLYKFIVKIKPLFFNRDELSEFKEIPGEEEKPPTILKNSVSLVQKKFLVVHSKSLIGIFQSLYNQHKLYLRNKIPNGDINLLSPKGRKQYYADLRSILLLGNAFNEWYQEKTNSQTIVVDLTQDESALIQPDLNCLRNVTSEVRLLHYWDKLSSRTLKQKFFLIIGCIIGVLLISLAISSGFGAGFGICALLVKESIEVLICINTLKATAGLGLLYFSIFKTKPNTYHLGEAAKNAMDDLTEEDEEKNIIPPSPSDGDSSTRSSSDFDTVSLSRDGDIILGEGDISLDENLSP